MKITDIRTIQLSYRAANPSMSAASFNAARNALIVEIETDAGPGAAGRDARVAGVRPDRYAQRH